MRKYIVIFLIFVCSSVSADFRIQFKVNDGWQQLGDTANYDLDQLEEMRRQEQKGSVVYLLPLPLPVGFDMGSKELYPYRITIDVIGPFTAELANPYMESLFHPEDTTNKGDPVRVKNKKVFLPEPLIDSLSLLSDSTNMGIFEIDQLTARKMMKVYYYKPNGKIEIKDGDR